MMTHIFAGHILKNNYVTQNSFCYCLLISSFLQQLICELDTVLNKFISRKSRVYTHSYINGLYNNFYINLYI